MLSAPRTDEKSAAGMGCAGDTRGSGTRKVDARFECMFMRTRHACADAVRRRRGRTCVEALGTMRSEESENELDWLLSMGLMWATDLKTGLKGSAVLLLAAQVVYCMPCMR